MLPSYGGEDGAEVVDLVERLRRPTIVVMHTVLRRPSAGQREVVEELAGQAVALVVQSGAARDRLLAAHDIDPDLVHLLSSGAGVIVPHGDATAIAAAIREPCTDPEKAACMIAAARRKAPTLFWDSVARAYRRLAVSVVERREVAV